MLISAEHGYSAGRGPLMGFLLGVARNHVRRWLERDRAFLPLAESAEDLQNTPGAAAGDLLGDLTRQENIEAVRRAVLTLPPDDREVVALCDLVEIDYSAAAKILGCPIGTVRSRLHHGRTMLVAKLRAARCLA
ncbi:MAG TPA: RNA polymerase sigma factor [Bryobacteraceae bacterium]|nr:RNA polymerase sigma factor [Bryobacteraceae bacterium]